MLITTKTIRIELYVLEILVIIEIKTEQNSTEINLRTYIYQICRVGIFQE